jgi:signal transduction histidine kinase
VTVRSRLHLTLAGIILLLVLPALYGVTQLQRLRELAEVLETMHAGDAQALGHLRASLVELDRNQRSFVASPEEAQFREAMRQHLREARHNLDQIDERVYGPALAWPQALLDSLALATGRLEAMIDAGERDRATDYFERVKPLLEESRAALDPVAQAMDRRGRRVRAEAVEVSLAASHTTLLVVALALLLTAALGLWTVGALSRPLGRLSAATTAVANGNFVAPPDLPYDRSDEIGELSRSFGAMTERLAELDRLKAEFVSLATHELKTPINVIAGYAELLDEGLYGELDRKQSDVVGLIQDQTRVLTRLVNQLLDLSRFEAGALALEWQAIDIYALLSSVEDTFRALATQKQVRFVVETDPSLPKIAYGDPDRIQHEVMGNLLSNAFKFTPTGGEVRVRAWGEGGELHLEVSDTGTGIPQAEIPHIFDKYYQVGADAKSKGSGLGLAIVQHVIEAHEGEITATSREGEGTRFHIRLPQDRRSE